MTRVWRGLSKRTRARLVAMALVGLVVIIAVWRARPPSHLTIETGPIGGSYYAAAQTYQTILAQRGIDLKLVPKSDTLEIVRDVANPQTGMDIGFIAQDISASRSAPLFSLGQTELQPLFIFANAKLGRRTVLDDLRGRSIVMTPAHSATSEAATRLFQLYDITKDNTSFTYLPLDEGVKQLHEGRFDAGAFMLAPENPVVRSLANDTGLHLVPLLETKAITDHLPFLRAVVLPRGIYNIADGIPPVSTPMVAAPVGIIVRKGLHPYLIYSLLDVLSQVHRGPSFLGDAGEFPTPAGSQLAVHPLALDYYRSGIPWIYRELPPWLGSAIDRYELLGLGLVVLVVLGLVVIWLADVVLAIAERCPPWRRIPSDQPDSSRRPQAVPADARE